MAGSSPRLLFDWGWDGVDGGEQAGARAARDGTAATHEFIEEYRLLRPLGRGGMGQVYLAHDTLLDRPVAVKFIASGPLPPSPANKERFFIEARAVARLSHPNVLAIYRVGEQGGRPFLVSELVRGKTLGQVLKPVPWERAHHIALGLSRGLAAVHRCGVLHRDIKPANVMLTAEDEVKLLDFGLAKLLSEVDEPEIAKAERPAGPLPPDLTRPGVIVGTPLYMAPEVRAGAPASCASDIYAVGSLLYELCTGLPPRLHRQRHAETQAAPSAESGRQEGHNGVEAEVEPAPLTERAPQVDPRFAAVVDRCLQLQPGQRYASGDHLRDALEGLLPAPAADTLPQGNPYRGLLPFEAEHRALFFGRGAEIRAILDRLRTEPLVLVAGDSGVGKSSLCRAGVLPRCAEGAIPGGRVFQIVSILPGAHPLHALLSALAPLCDLPEEELHRAALADPTVPGQLLRKRPQGTLLFIDQMEELVTLSPPDESARCAEILGDLATRSPALRLLASARGDFLTRLALTPRLGDALLHGLYLLRPLSPEGVRDAIVGPVHRTGVAFESASLIDQLALGAPPGGLPLLQFALAELWEARDQARRIIPARALDEIGGVAGALVRHADGVLLALPQAQREAARRVLVRLVSADGTRARRTAAELARCGPAAEDALEALIKGRLVLARRDEGQTVYEVAHEALLGAWGALRRWLDADIDQQRVRQRLSDAAAEWERLGRAPEALWGQRQLVEARSLSPQQLPGRDQAFLNEARRRATRRRLLRRVAAVGLPLLLGLGYGAVRLRVRQDVDRAVAGQVARAQGAMQVARDRAAQATAARGRALTLFDAVTGDAGAGPGTWQEAERLWVISREKEDQAEGAYVRASQLLESALTLERGSSETRSLLADVTLERILLAERRPRLARPSERAELAERLALHDSDGARERRLDAPARLRISTWPTPAAVEVRRYETGEDQFLSRVVATHAAPSPAEGLELALPAGSYLLILRAPERPPVRLPLLLRRGEEVPVRMTLPAQVPPGYIYIPAGRFLFGADGDDDLRRGFLDAPPLHEQRTGAYLIGATEVSFAQWLEFLRDLPQAERAQRLPRGADLVGGLTLVQQRDGRMRLDLRLGTHLYQAAEGQAVRYGARDRRASQDWRRFPVSAISSQDALSYLAWLRRSGRLPGARLCTELEWERAARGADGRTFPHGNRLSPDDANYDETYGREPMGYGPDEVGAHPTSESPFGVQDLTGNVWEFVSSSRQRGEVVLRGGSWYQGDLTARIPNRNVSEPTMRHVFVGLRVCASRE